MSNRNFTPFSQAFSAMAIVRPKGHTIPPVGAYSAAATSFVTFGSSPLISSLERIRIPGTPFFFPFSSSFSNLSMSCASKQSTKDPLRLKGKSKSLDSCSIMALPLTFILAIIDPGSLSKPAWTMPLFALDVPSHTSLFLSRTNVSY